MHLNSELKQRRRRRQRERQKSKQTRLAKQQPSTCIMFFCTFLCRRCTNTTWNVLVTRFMEDDDFLFLNLDTVPTIKQILWNSTRVIKFKNSTNSLPSDAFRCRRVCLSSLILRDLTILRRRRPWKRRLKIDLASFQTVWRLSQVGQLLALKKGI